MTWWVYIIETEAGPLYTGITTNLERRFRQHLGAIKGGAKFFNSNTAKEVVFQQAFENRSEATRFEAQVKKLTRAEKLKLIKTGS